MSRTEAARDRCDRYAPFSGNFSRRETQAESFPKTARKGHKGHTQEDMISTATALQPRNSANCAVRRKALGDDAATVPSRDTASNRPLPVRPGASEGHDRDGGRDSVTARRSHFVRIGRRSGAPFLGLAPAENSVTGAVYLQRILDIQRKSFVVSIYRQRGKFTNSPLSDVVTIHVEAQVSERKQDKATREGTSRGVRVIGPLGRRAWLS